MFVFLTSFYEENFLKYFLIECIVSVFFEFPGKLIFLPFSGLSSSKFVFSGPKYVKKTLVYPWTSISHGNPLGARTKPHDAKKDYLGARIGVTAGLGRQCYKIVYDTCDLRSTLLGEINFTPCKKVLFTSHVYRNVLILTVHMLYILCAIHNCRGIYF